MPRPLSLRALLPLAALVLSARLSVPLEGATTTAARDFLGSIRTWEDFLEVSLPGSSPSVLRVAKYLAPARSDPQLLPAMFQNAHFYPFHHEFLAAVFPDRFPGLTLGDYLDLVERRATRSYHAGTLTLYLDPVRGGVYGFSVFTDGSDPAEMLEPAEVRAVYLKLKQVFFAEAPGVSLEYAPLRSAEIARARSWVNPGFPVYLAPSTSPPDVVGYTAAVGYGRLRRMTLTQLAAAVAAGELTFQDLLVLDEAPADIETVIGGVVTGSIQGELSHLTVRLARRNLPNAYVRDARQAFAAWEGKLVRLQVESDRYSVREATPQEAEAFWQESRPRLPAIPGPDEAYTGLPLLGEVPLEEGGVPAVARFGGKTAGLARLYRFLPPRYQTEGFGIPVRHYLEFLRSNRRPSLDGARLVTYEVFIAEMLADPHFRTDAAFRRSVLEELRERAEDDAQVDPALVEALRARVLQVFAGPEVKVRFRSSSNAEDSLEFTGAGLYDSTSVCLLDDLDGDETGPSRCDPQQPRERTVARGLKRVWMSLWNAAAYEEREYFGIDHRRAAMAVLVTRAYPAEDSNGVAFTGNPSNRVDRSFLVNVQVGDTGVVTPVPGVESEKDILVMDGDQVGRILRARPSSLVVPGQHVLSDGQLRDLGEVMALVREEFPRGLDLEGHPPGDVLVDVEFKFQDGQLVLKQARPLLLVDPAPPGPVFRVEVLAVGPVCGLWEEFREPEDEYRLKSRLYFRPGGIDLPARAGAVAGSLVERIELGPGRQVLEPLDSGLFRLRPPRSDGTIVEYSWQFDQHFAAGDLTVQVSVDSLSYVVQDGAPVNPVIKIDDQLFNQERFMGGAVLDSSGEPRFTLRYGSCTYSTLPLWEIRYELEGEDLVLFHERYQVPFAGSGPANVLRGEASLGGASYVETSYWRLVYAADHHNWNEEFELVLDPPQVVSGVAGVKFIHVQEGFEDIPRGAALLDQDRRTLRDLKVVRYSKTEVFTPLPGMFRRGDAGGDGRVDLSDAVGILSWLFTAGTPPWCEDPADVDDSGRVDISDPIRILHHLFLGGDPPSAPGPAACGLDEERDPFAECPSPGRGCSP